MADEITTLGYLTVTKNGITHSMPETATSREQTPDMSGDDVAHSSQSIGTSAEAIGLNDTAVGGWAMFYNSDATNFVEIGDDPGSGFVPFLRLNAGEWAGPLRLSTDITALQAKADTAAIILHYLITDP